MRRHERFAPDHLRHSAERALIWHSNGFSSSAQAISTLNLAASSERQSWEAAVSDVTLSVHLTFGRQVLVRMPS